MALTRKLLKGMGLTEEQIDSVIDAHTETVDALKTQIKALETDANTLKDVQKELDGYKNGKDWKGEYDKLDKSFKDYKAEIAGKEALQAKQAAFRKLLTAENIPGKFHDRIIKMTDFDGMEMDGDALKDEAGQCASIKKEWGEYVATTDSKGDRPETPPGTGKTTRTKDEILAIKDTSERQRAIAENHELFGF